MPRGHATVSNADIARMLATLRTATEQLAQQQRELAAAVKRMARGTGDVTEDAIVAAEIAAAAPPPATLETRIEEALRVTVCTPDDLAIATGATSEEVAAVIAGAGDRVFNLGSELLPRWVWVIGDDTSTADLMDACRNVLRERPLEMHELERATGARRNRLSGILNRLGAMPHESLLNLSTDKNRGRWFLATPAKPRGR